MKDFLFVLGIAGVASFLTYLAAPAAESLEVPDRVVSGALQFAAGVIAALVVFSLMPPAIRAGSPLPVALAFFCGGALFVSFDYVSARRLAAKSATSPIAGTHVTPLGLYFGVFLDVVIDGVMYVLFSVFDRGEKHRLHARIQAAATPAEGIEAIAEKLDPILEPITRAHQRQLLYEDMLAQLSDSRPKPVGIKREDLVGAVGCVLVAVISVLPSLAPFVILPGNFMLALRVSNLVSFAMLFAAGYGSGRITFAGWLPRTVRKNT